MIKKKAEKSNLEKKRVLFFEMGIAVVLALLLVAFEWGTQEIEVATIDYGMDDNFVAEIDAVRTKREQPKPPPPPMPQFEIEIITDPDVDIEEEDFIWTTDVNIGDGIALIEMDPEENVEDDIPFIRVEKMPTYQGNSTAYFQRHLQQLVEYPTIAQEEGVFGKVYVEFVVDENGKIIRERILKSPHPSLSDAVLLAMKKTDDWEAGEQRGRKVKVSFTVPVLFKLN